jgi:hypothetical protein
MSPREVGAYEGQSLVIKFVIYSQADLTVSSASELVVIGRLIFKCTAPAEALGQRPPVSDGNCATGNHPQLIHLTIAPRWQSTSVEHGQSWLIYPRKASADFVDKTAWWKQKPAAGEREF